MIYNWSKYRRKQNNLEKSKFNDIVNNLLIYHYKYLHNLLVKNESDESTFNDTYLKLTILYNPDSDFIDQFKYYFKQLSCQYYKDDRCYNYAETKVEVYTDNLMMMDNDSEEIKSKSVTTKNTTLINDIKKYAIFEKEQKYKDKVDQKNRKTKHLSK